MAFVEILLWLHALSTLYMVGLIWFVQVVHYPLFAWVADATYRDYQKRHMERTGWVVGPPMLVEAGSSLGLAILAAELSQPVLAWAGLLLLALVWGVTALCSVPAHARLLEGFDKDVHRRLVTTNWLRTLPWTARGGIAVAMLASG